MTHPRAVMNANEQYLERHAVHMIRNFPKSCVLEMDPRQRAAL